MTEYGNVGARKRLKLKQAKPQGEGGPTIIWVKERRRRARSVEQGGLLGQLAHTAVAATAVAAESYLRGHERSNRKKENGWLRDLPDNVYSAVLNAQRRLWLWKRDDP